MITLRHNQKEQSMDNKRAVLINLPESLVQQLDEAAQALNMARTDVIRRSLKRDIDYIVRYEIQTALQERLERERRYMERVKGLAPTLSPGGER
jgi:metal-responsive CopG/Arc/MetJ family transcriptional regulator